jgi:hypothetical protein
MRDETMQSVAFIKSPRNEDGSMIADEESKLDEAEESVIIKYKKSPTTS